MRYHTKIIKGFIPSGLIIVFVIVVVFLGVTLLAAKSANKPLPGTEVPDMGREHITDINGITYNSNPPTSGTHFPIWAQRGVYDRVISDGYLIHSLEHGYIIISYNCGIEEKNIRSLLVKSVYAHDGVDDGDDETIIDATPSAQPLTQMNIVLENNKSFFDPENAPEKEIALPKTFTNASCKKLVEELSVFLKQYRKLIIIPRPSLEKRIALTAWGRIDTFNTFDNERIYRFVKALHDQGPEKTIE